MLLDVLCLLSIADREQVCKEIRRVGVAHFTAQALADLLMTVLYECRKELEEGAAVTVEPTRIRVRRLPRVNNS